MRCHLLSFFLSAIVLQYNIPGQGVVSYIVTTFYAEYKVGTGEVDFRQILRSGFRGNTESDLFDILTDLQSPAALNTSSFSLS